ncbi:MAG: hypothetical protein JSS02_10980 [Planctomycetes bacterium]|nr:hypothetical protein [Planctomycetota bacterium]
MSRYGQGTRITSPQSARPAGLRRGGWRILPVLLVSAGCVAGCGPTGAPSAGTEAAAEKRLERRADKGPVKLLVQVSPAEPRLSDLVDLDVIVEAQPEVEIKPPTFGKSVGDFQIRDYSERPASTSETQVTRRFHYQLEPVQAGKHLIRSIAIEFIDRRPQSETKGEPVQIETNPIEVNVTSELGDDTPDLANLEPMLPPQAVDEVSPLVWWIVGGIVPLVVLALLLLARRKQVRTVAPRRLSPEEIAHAALNALLAENLPGQGLVKEFFLRLTGIVRQYIEDTTGLRAPEQTTEEFLRDMRSRAAFAPPRSVRLAEFLEAADMIKYAGQQPAAGQIEESIARAREFVDLPETRTAAPFAAGVSEEGAR